MGQSLKVRVSRKVSVLEKRIKKILSIAPESLSSYGKAELSALQFAVKTINKQYGLAERSEAQKELN